MADANPDEILTIPAADLNRRHGSGIKHLRLPRLQQLDRAHRHMNLSPVVRQTNRNPIPARRPRHRQQIANQGRIPKHPRAKLFEVSHPIDLR